MNYDHTYRLFIETFEKMFDWEIYAEAKAFWLLLFIPVLALWYIIKQKYFQATVHFSSTTPFEKIPTSPLSYLRHLPFVLQMLALGFIIFALARPQASLSWEEEKTEGIDIVIALDISNSMMAMDFKPNRLEASKAIAKEFVGSRTNDRIGLVVYGSEAFTQCPLTIDHSRLQQLFDEIHFGMIEGGTAIGMGLATSVNRLKESSAASKIIILLTDGENTAGEIDPKTAAELAKTYGIKVYTIGVGTKGTALSPYQQDMYGKIYYKELPVVIDEETMGSIAKITGGKYFRATSNQKLKAIYAEIDRLEKTEIASLKYYKKNELFMPFAASGLLLLLLAAPLNWFLFRKLP
ncbi:MAG: VWA domain-containing protein [Bacteroidetes bacterium]|nr:VWA domain-containing protein [Bacteroidota bacterium]